jgi:hypothetical protein
MSTFRVALTGGPGGGKSALVRELAAAGATWVAIPEAAPCLFHAGLDGRTREFERAVVALQLAMEDSCEPLGARQICHRGALDALAYWLRNGWPEEDFFPATGASRPELLARYDGVVHLVTAADGATAHYLRWPHAHRPETTTEAIHIDGLCARAWAGHPRYVRISNEDRSWAEKSQIARELLESWTCHRP